MKALNDATRAQMRAARPDASTWLAANAGSGKTRVLTDRVARLLLDGVQPQHILCLTYTKAAASEMQNRLFKRLGQWAMLSDAALETALIDLGVTAKISPDLLRDARTLFARAIETPGGLKIQTIHSFCAALLRRFPLEAKVSPQFTEIEDRAADLLRAEIVDGMADGEDAALVADLARYYTGEDFSALTRAIVQHRDAFASPLDRGDLLALFDQPSELTTETLASRVFLGGEAELLANIIPALKAKGGMDGKAGDKLATLAALDLQSLPILESVFLTGSSAASPYAAKIGKFPTKASQAVLADYMPALEAFMLRVEDARDARLTLKTVEKTHALHRFAARFVPQYEEQKLLRGWLDFDDLILKARELLTDPAVAAWVLFRIDGGIDHILVDEAQDTSPAQWDVIRKLAAEFSSGEGAREDVLRTLFVVGDKKQSIYSFQGADPREFDRMQIEFQQKFDAVEHPFQSETLAYSFRSSNAVLQLVDRVFEPFEKAGFDVESRHIAFKSELPGRVDLWPVIEKQEDVDDRIWSDPLDRRSDHHHTVLLARQVASQIKSMIDNREMLPVDTKDGHGKRPVRAGDFLILVQRRSSLFEEIISACKSHDLPIAGADRLKVGAELAVRDLKALLSFLSVPEDSLSLATALKSPLFGWDEQMLFAAAHHRKEDDLWISIRTRTDDYPDTLAILRDLRANLDYLRPYDLIERILTRHGGRGRLLARLGTEAEDGINALLSQALAYERSTVPSLTGFLVWMESDELEIKRQIDSASDQIRVMTVHGSKGLEAPIVILPDTGKRDIQIKDEIIRVGGSPVWKAGTADMPKAMTSAIGDMKAAQFDERLRLLYVALTRAEKWLIIAAAGDLSKQGESWYQLAERAMKATATPLMVEGREGLRIEHGDWGGLPEVSTAAPISETVDLPACLSHPAPEVAPFDSTISPSELGGAKALAGEAGMDEDTAKRYGTLVHFYLENLAGHPSEHWPRIITALDRNPDQHAVEKAAALSEARAVLEDPELAFLFTPESLAEVSVSAELGNNRLHGTIDRLIIDKTRVLAVDYKSNRVVPKDPELCPDGILRQMGSYAHALAQIYPDRRIDTAILWTRTGSLMMLPHDSVTAALESTQYLDDKEASN